MVRKVEKFDIMIIGGGVVGCATARQAVKDFPGRKIAVLEKNSAVGLEASGRNSGVLHSGFHHPAGSLKEKLANKGNTLAKKYTCLNNIPTLGCGMLIVFPKISSFADIFKDFGILKALYFNGQSQNVKFSVVGRKGIKKLEPNIEGVAGIFIPEVVVIDFVAFVKSLFQEASTLGVDFFFNTKVKSLKIDNEYFVVNDQTKAKAIINCAGIFADDIAGLAGIRYKQYPIRGEYYEVVGPKKDMVKRLVNPAVPPGHSSKGIHFSPRTDGRMFIGPSFKIIDDKTNYDSHQTPPDVFLEAIRSFMPHLSESDLRWGYSGIRAKLSLEHDLDFIINLDMKKPIMVNNIGINSPGLSSSMAIAQMNCDLLKSAMDG